jgi:TonB family protein
MILHVTFFFFLFALPAGVPSPELVRIYKVKVVEAPRQPKARRLEVSTQPISELRLESPPAIPEPPPTPPPSKAAAPPLQPPSPKPATPAAVPEPPTLKTATPAELPALPAPPKQSSTPPAVTAPKPETPASVKSVRPGAVPPKQEPSAMEQARLRVEQSKARMPEPGPPVVSPGASRAPRSRISLRMYKASVQEEVQRKYKFPGGFDKSLWVRVRLVIARDGSIRGITFLERSGNEHFDRAALLSIRRTRLPPVPDNIEGDSITQVVLFRP